MEGEGRGVADADQNQPCKPSPLDDNAPMEARRVARRPWAHPSSEMGKDCCTGRVGDLVGQGSMASPGTPASSPSFERGNGRAPALHRRRRGGGSLLRGGRCPRFPRALGQREGSERKVSGGGRDYFGEAADDAFMKLTTTSSATTSSVPSSSGAWSRPLTIAAVLLVSHAAALLVGVTLGRQLQLACSATSAASAAAPTSTSLAAFLRRVRGACTPLYGLRARELQPSCARPSVAPASTSATRCKVLARADREQSVREAEAVGVQLTCLPVSVFTGVIAALCARSLDLAPRHTCAGLRPYCIYRACDK